MAFTEDISAFINHDTPGYAVATIGVNAVDGVFGSEYAEAFGVIGGSSPVFVCASADVAGIVEGQSLTIAGVAFTLAADPVHDSILKTGLATLKLEAV